MSSSGHTFADLAKALDRPVVYLSGLQARFELPVLETCFLDSCGLAKLADRRLLLTNQDLGFETACN